MLLFILLSGQRGWWYYAREYNSLKEQLAEAKEIIRVLRANQERSTMSEEYSADLLAAILDELGKRAPVRRTRENSTAGRIASRQVMEGRAGKRGLREE